jgi:hypothetical protein
VVTETYAVLTRMPEPFRLDAQLVADYLAQQWGGRVIAPDAGLYESLTTAVATVGGTGAARRTPSSGSPPSASVTNCCRSAFVLNALTDLWGSITGHRRLNKVVRSRRLVSHATPDPISLLAVDSQTPFHIAVF